MAAAGQLRAGGSEDALKKRAVSSSEGHLEEMERPVQEKIEQPLEQGNPEFPQQPGIQDRLKSQSKISKSAGMQPKKKSSRIVSEAAPAKKSGQPAAPGSARGPSPATYGSSPATKDSSNSGYGGSGSKKND